jgi:hypothetical protein
MVAAATAASRRKAAGERGKVAAARAKVAAARAPVATLELAGTVPVRRSTGSLERRAGTCFLEDDGGTTALPIELVRMSLRKG